MSDVLEKLSGAGDWEAYYAVYRSLYQDMIQDRWALGRAAFAEQLHHLAVPDASGATCGAVNWAVYSQPSLETLGEALILMADLFSREPHRIRSSRYFFVIPEETQGHSASKVYCLQVFLQ